MIIHAGDTSSVSSMSLSDGDTYYPPSIKISISTETNKDLLYEFPTYIKPFYEIPVHKKSNFDDYDTAVAVPIGKRAYLWFRYVDHNPTACVIEVGRNRELLDHVHFIVNFRFPESFALGTILSGYWIDGEEDCPNRRYFVTDEIHQFEGHCFGNPFPVPLIRKFEAYCEFYEKMSSKSNGLVQEVCSVHSAIMWSVCGKTWKECKKELVLPSEWKENMGYQLKHIQFRSSTKVMPYCNQLQTKNPWISNESTLPYEMNETAAYLNKIMPTNNGDAVIGRKFIPDWNFCFYNRIYSSDVVLYVTAGIAFDVYYYHLKDDIVLDDVLIADLKTSKMMNEVFRSIPESHCLDIIEESDDEEEFQDLREDKYVDLQKKVLVRCIFNRKFKKWIPVEPLEMNIYNQSLVPSIDQFIKQQNKISRENIYVKRYDSSTNQPGKFPSKQLPFQTSGRKKETYRSTTQTQFKKTNYRQQRGAAQQQQYRQ